MLLKKKTAMMNISRASIVSEINRMAKTVCLNEIPRSQISNVTIIHSKHACKVSNGQIFRDWPKGSLKLQILGIIFVFKVHKVIK